MELLTIAEIAKRINIPESTARFYRDRFDEYIPSQGKGRSKRYKPEAIEVLRLIAERFKNNHTATDIADELSLKYSRFVDARPEQQQQTAVEQQQGSAMVVRLMESQVLAIQQMATAMQVVAEQSKEIESLRNELKVIKEEQHNHEEMVAARLAEHDKAVRAEIIAMMEERQKQEEEQKPWWKRILG